jgi:2-polyprenyl-3-methyl-5-hydroxy-6-metoxy-1,4-benzoquinol methylase
MKYFDHKNNRFLDLVSDGCELAEYKELYGKAFFARHPKGFKVFLPPNKISSSNEYAESDPYSVIQNLDSDFHRRRVELTIDLAHEAISEVHNTPQILDLGCGQGHITERIQKALNLADITGLDYSISAIEYAHEHFPGIDFSVGDAYDCPYANEFFDLVVCNNLWEHVPDPLFLLSRIKTILKPGGSLIISTPSRYRIDNLLRVIRGKSVVFMSVHHVTEYTVGQVVEQLEYGGLRICKILSRHLSVKNPTIEGTRQLLAIFLSLVGSHHQLESTVFYLAKKYDDR